MTPEKPRQGEWVRVPRQPTEEMVRAAFGVRLPVPEEISSDAVRLIYKAMLAAAPAALGTPEGGYFSVVSWRRKGDDLWLYHKASGNKKANLYELALVGEIEALRAERIALSPTPNQEKKE